MDLATLSARLDELDWEFQRRMAPVNRFLADNLRRVNQPDGLTPTEFDRQAREVRERAGDGEAALHALLDELCPAYLRGTSDERAAVRAAVAAKRTMPDRVRGYAHVRARSIRSPEDVETLRVALSAMSIENCAMDYRDTLLALAEIYVRAERAGIDPQPHFEAVAAVSSSERPRGGRTPLAQMLPVFHTYAVLPARRGKP
jgi:hypothetical protein